MKQLKVQILQNKKAAEGFYKMRLGSPYLAKNMKPGQFIEVRCSEALDPLLRRPFSAHRILKNGIEILYKVVGKGTKIFSEKKKGEYLDIIGPLGNGFDTQYAIRNTQYAILIAGGIGVAPLVALAEELAHSFRLRPAGFGGQAKLIAHRKKKKNITVIIGAKTKSHILCESEFRSLGCEVKVTTEDGTKGYNGLASDLLRYAIYDIRSTIYACGPNAMLKAVAEMAKSKQIPCQVSLEEEMACGVGVCLGCPVKVHTKYDVRNTMYEYKMVCKDGPVFNAEEILWK